MAEPTFNVVGHTCIGQCKIKRVDGKFQVTYRPTGEVIHEGTDCSLAIKAALEKSGLKGAFDASGFAGVGKEDTQC